MLTEYFGCLEYERSAIGFLEDEGFTKCKKTFKPRPTTFTVNDLIERAIEKKMKNKYEVLGDKAGDSVVESEESWISSLTSLPAKLPPDINEAALGSQ